MNKKFFLILSIAAVLLIPASLSALDLGSGLAKGAATQAGYDANTTDTTFAETIGSIIKIVLSFTGVIFLLLTVYAGFLWMNARGEEAQIEKSQKIIRSAIIGLVITIGAYSITNFVVPKIVAKTTGGPAGDARPNLEQIARCRADCRSSCNAQPVNGAFDRCVSACESNC